MPLIPTPLQVQNCLSQVINETTTVSVNVMRTSVNVMSLSENEVEHHVNVMSPSENEVEHHDGGWARYSNDCSSDRGRVLLVRCHVPPLSPCVQTRVRAQRNWSTSA
jgi:hypothetical protein